MNSISITGSAEAKAWASKAEALNQRTQALLDEVAATLRQVGTDSEGSVVDQIMDMGEKLSTATLKLIEGMNGIMGVVNGLLSAVGNVIEEGVGIIGKAVTGLFG